MKIILKKTAYVQMNDLGFLAYIGIPTPESIFMKLSKKGVVVNNRNSVLIDDRNRYDFMEFNKPEEIEFFKNLDWMIDYNDVKDLTNIEFIDLGRSFTHQRNLICREFNAMSEEEQDKHQDMVQQSDLLKFKIYSLRDILWFKQGHIEMKLPEEFSSDSEQKIDKGIRRLIKNFFNKKKQ